MIQVRIASPDDAPGILKIYAPYILTTAFSFETVVPDIGQFEQRITAGLLRFPWIVCTKKDAVAAYVYASAHREREAYQWSCECSVYVADDCKGLGIGKELYMLLFQLLKMQGMKNVYAAITLPNDASVRLHEKCGFRHFATYDHIGYKLGTWHNVGWWKLQLNDYDLKPPPPLRFSQLDPSLYSTLFETAAQRIGSKLTD